MYAAGALLGDEMVLSALCTGPDQLSEDILYKWTNLRWNSCLWVCTSVLTSRWHLGCLYLIFTSWIATEHICGSSSRVLSTCVWQGMCVDLVEIGIWCNSHSVSLRGAFEPVTSAVWGKKHNLSVLFQNSKLICLTGLCVWLCLQVGSPCFPSSHRTWSWWLANLWHYHVPSLVTMALSCGSKMAWRSG